MGAHSCLFGSASPIFVKDQMFCLFNFVKYLLSLKIRFVSIGFEWYLNWFSFISCFLFLHIFLTMSLVFFWRALTKNHIFLTMPSCEHSTLFSFTLNSPPKTVFVSHTKIFIFSSPSFVYVFHESLLLNLLLLTKLYRSL